VQDVFDTHDDLGLQSGYRAQREQMAGSGSRRLTLIAGALGCGLLSSGCIWEYLSHRTHTVPVIEADSRPMRVKPVNPGGMQIAGAGESILSGPEQIPQSLAPPPEMPDPGSLHLQEQSARARESAAPPAAGEMPMLTAQNSAPPSVPPPPATTEAPAAVAPAAPLAAPPAAITPHLPAPTSGKAVQLASFGSAAAANAEWARLSRLMPDLLAHRRPEVSQVEHDGKTVWRLRTGGFADAAAVTNFCNQVRAKGAACAAVGL
jgi:hypothetical protein